MKDWIDSILIGGIATYLPFWTWDNSRDQIMGALGLIGVVYIARMCKELTCYTCQLKKDPQSCNSNKDPIQYIYSSL